MADRSLEDLLGTVESPVELLRNSQAGPNVYPGVPAEYTNWRDEQIAWQTTLRALQPVVPHGRPGGLGPRRGQAPLQLAVNSFEGFTVDKAKHFVPCTPDGYVIGDVILFHLAENRFNLVGRAPALNWITYHAETGDEDVSVELDQRWALRTDGRRRSYRFQIQGPNAMQVIEKVLGGPAPELKFFNMTTITIAGRPVRALRHGMVGQPGWELFGPWEDEDAGARGVARGGGGVRAAAGRRAGLLVEHARVRLDPLAAPGRVLGREPEGVPRVAARRRVRGLGLDRGQLLSASIVDYYLTPWDLGYGSYVKFDHDFIGREALEDIAGQEHRQKVTLALDDEDVTSTIGMMFGPADERAKFMDWPSAVYCMHPFDRVTADDETVGVSTWIGYSANEGKMLTLAVLEPEYAEPGTEVTLVWGEEDGGSSKPTVEPHVQTEMRATVSPVPYTEVVRRSYPSGPRSDLSVRHRAVGSSTTDRISSRQAGGAG